MSTGQKITANDLVDYDIEENIIVVNKNHPVSINCAMIVCFQHACNAQTIELLNKSESEAKNE
jgi:hypothetical protein